MRLSSFITEYRESILQEWEDFARSLESLSASKDVGALRDHASAMLDTIVSDLETPQTSSQQSFKSKRHVLGSSGTGAAESHAESRLESGYSIDQLVSEFRALRASVLKLWAKQCGPALDTASEDMTRFNEAIDQALAESVACYSRQSVTLLNQSEARYRTLFETMGQGYCELKLLRDASHCAVDQHYLTLNPAFERMFGIPIKQAQGCKASEVFPDLDPWWTQSFDRIARAGRPEHLEYELTSAGRWYEVWVYPRGGDLLSVLYEDVTERKHAADALRKSETHLRAVLEQAPLAIVFTEPSGDILFSNALFDTLWRREDHITIGSYSDIYEGYHLDGRPIRSEEWPGARALLKGEVIDGEVYEVVKTGGTRFTCWLAARPIRGNGGEIVGAVVMSRDITKERRTQEALRASEERRALGLEAAGIGDWSYDIASGLIDCSPRVHALLGIGLGEPVTIERHDRLIDADDRADVEAARTHALDPVHGGEYRVDFRLHTTNEGVRWIRSIGRVIFDDDADKPHAMYMIGAMIDITIQKETEEALRENDRRKDKFLAMLAHELRNPLAPINSAANILMLPDVDDVQIKQTSQIIARQVKHMTSLVDDLLDVSRVTRGLIQLEKTQVDFRRIVADAVEQVSPLIQTRHHQLVLDLPEEIAVVCGDNKRLVQVVANMLGNAAKYTQEGGTISLKVEVGPAVITLIVEDNGAGMAPQLVEHVFDLFMQAERTSDRSSGGLGLGLALVKSLVDLHDGTVTCASAGLGKGSRFTVSLPRLMQTNQWIERRRNSREQVKVGKGLKILIVDDNVDAAEMLAVFLEDAGHEVYIENQSVKGLERARKQVPDVCLLDIGLPEMDGNELAQRLRKQPETSDTVLIAVTGYGQEEDRQATRAAGFNYHMVKPVDFVQLSAALATAGHAS